MDMENQTKIIHFIINGISDVSEIQTLLFVLVFIIYFLTMIGNITIAQLICFDSHLHNPMYFFLVNLSFLDMLLVNITLPKVLGVFISGDNKVPFSLCLIQMYAFSSLTVDELSMLTAMSYDRYVAICKPLHYQMIMSHSFCTLLASICWVLGFLEIVPFTIILSKISCWKSNVINHFFCDLVPLVKLSCTYTSALEMLTIVEGIFPAGFTPFSLTFISYVFIITTIMKIRSNTGRSKAFYTCSSHLTVVILFYLTIFCQYMTPTTVSNLTYKKLFSLFNTAAVPILNPIIYSLKNNDVKLSLRRRLKLFSIRD